MSWRRARWLSPFVAVAFIGQELHGGQVQPVQQTHENCWAAAAAMIRAEQNPGRRFSLCQVAKDAILDVTHTSMCRCSSSGVNDVLDGPCLGATPWGSGFDYTPAASQLRASNYPSDDYYTTPLASLQTAGSRPLIVWLNRGTGHCGEGQAGHLVVVDDSSGSKVRVVDPAQGKSPSYEPEDDFRCGSILSGLSVYGGHCVAYLRSPAAHQLEALDQASCSAGKRLFPSLSQAYNAFVGDAAQIQSEFGGAGACDAARPVAIHDTVTWRKDDQGKGQPHLGPKRWVSDLCLGGDPPFLVTYEKGVQTFRIRRLGQRGALAIYAKFWSLPKAGCGGRGLLVVDYPDIDGTVVADLDCFLNGQPSAVFVDELLAPGLPDLRRLQELETIIATSKQLGTKGPVRNPGDYQ